MRQDRQPESFLHGVSGPVVILPARVAALLEARFPMARLRADLRGTDPEVSNVLLALHEAARRWHSSVTGTKSAPPPEPAGSSNWVSTTSAAARSGVTDRAIRRAISEGRLDAIRSEGRWRISTSALTDYINARR